MRRNDALVRAGISGLAVAITCVFFIDFCNLIYRCGCKSLWAGADRLCNVHIPSAKHCPFCSHGATAYAIVLGLILIPQLLVGWWPSHWDWRIRLMAAVLVFPLVATIAALAIGIVDGYWS